MTPTHVLKKMVCCVASGIYLWSTPALSQTHISPPARTSADPPIAEAISTSPDYKPGTVRHIVLFKYSDTVNSALRDRIKKRFLFLKESTRADGNRYITSIETGSQSSGEGLSAGFEQAFIVTFKSAGDRNYYVGSPLETDPRYFDRQHAAFKDFVGQYLAKDSPVLIFDYAVTR